MSLTNDTPFKVSTIAAWINDGRLDEGRMPLPEKQDQEEFFETFYDTMWKMGWTFSHTGKTIQQECLLQKGKNRYRLSLVDNRSYQFNKEI